MLAQVTYIGCLLGSLERWDSKASSLVPSIDIFLRIADKCRCVSGPEGGSELLSAILALISSASFEASLNSRIHGSEEDAIATLPKKENNIILTAAGYKNEYDEETKNFQLPEVENLNITRKLKNFQDAKNIFDEEGFKFTTVKNCTSDKVIQYLQQ